MTNAGWMLPLAVSTMIFPFSEALVIAGLFTILPGRIMHKVLFGT